MNPTDEELYTLFIPIYYPDLTPERSLINNAHRFADFVSMYRPISHTERLALAYSYMLRRVMEDNGSIVT